MIFNIISSLLNPMKKLAWGIGGLGGCLCCFSAQANTPSLSYISSASEFGKIHVFYLRQNYLPVSYDYGLSDGYNFYYPGLTNADSRPTVASDYYMLPRQENLGDPQYIEITNDGDDGFGYRSYARVDGTRLSASLESWVVDRDYHRIGRAAHGSLFTYANSGFTESFYIAPTEGHVVGDFGAIVLGVYLSGGFEPWSDYWIPNNGTASAAVNWKVFDTSGGSVWNGGHIDADWRGKNWLGRETLFNKIQFQYGIPFEIRLGLTVQTVNSGLTDFSAGIGYVEIPYGAILESGAQQAGFGSALSLYGKVFNSSIPNASNTTWDFGNGGGTFSVAVPESGTWLLMLLGIFAISCRINKNGKYF